MKIVKNFLKIMTKINSKEKRRRLLLECATFAENIAVLTVVRTIIFQKEKGKWTREPI